MRSIIIGDVHGCVKQLLALTEKVKPGNGDRIIMLGDLFDRGPDSYEVFETVKTMEENLGKRFVLLRGNHEDYLLQDKLTIYQQLVWERVGRGATVKSFRKHGKKMEDAIPWMKEHCRMYWKEERFQCVHAGLKVEPLEANDTYTMIHDHEVVYLNRYAGLLTVVGHIGLEAPMWFCGDGETTEELEYEKEIELPEKGTVCIDTGCGKNGWLTAMIIEEERFRLERA